MRSTTFPQGSARARGLMNAASQELKYHNLIVYGYFTGKYFFRWFQETCKNLQNKIFPCIVRVTVKIYVQCTSRTDSHGRIFLVPCKKWLEKKEEKK